MGISAYQPAKRWKVIPSASPNRLRRMTGRPSHGMRHANPDPAMYKIRSIETSYDFSGRQQCP
jgi:hypothetical protein